MCIKPSSNGRAKYDCRSRCDEAEYRRGHQSLRIRRNQKYHRAEFPYSVVPCKQKMTCIKENQRQLILWRRGRRDVIKFQVVHQMMCRGRLIEAEERKSCRSGVRTSRFSPPNPVSYVSFTTTSIFDFPCLASEIPPFLLKHIDARPNSTPEFSAFSPSPPVRSTQSTYSSSPHARHSPAMAPSSSTQHSSPPHESTTLPKRSLRRRTSNVGLATGHAAPSDGVATVSDRDGDLRGDAEDGHAHDTRGGNFPAQKNQNFDSPGAISSGGAPNRGLAR
jgi:hypothetical protein